VKIQWINLLDREGVLVSRTMFSGIFSHGVYTPKELIKMVAEIGGKIKITEFSE
jgi:hypothetical protein